MAEHDDQTVDDPDQRIAELEAENTRIRAALANSDQPCPYCSLSREDWAKCQSGFPGCERADDAMGCMEVGQRHRADELEAEVGRLKIIEAAYFRISDAQADKIMAMSAEEVMAMEIKEVGRDAAKEISNLNKRWMDELAKGALLKIDLDRVKVRLASAGETIRRQATELAGVREALEDAVFKCWGCQGRGGVGGINQFTECEVCKPWRQALAAHPGEPTGDWLLRIFKTLPPEEAVMLRAAIGEEPPSAAVAERRVVEAAMKCHNERDGRRLGEHMGAIADACDALAAAREAGEEKDDG